MPEDFWYQLLINCCKDDPLPTPELCKVVEFSIDRSYYELLEAMSFDANASLPDVFKTSLKLAAEFMVKIGGKQFNLTAASLDGLK